MSTHTSSKPKVKNINPNTKNNNPNKGDGMNKSNKGQVANLNDIGSIVSVEQAEGIYSSGKEVMLNQGETGVERVTKEGGSQRKPRVTHLKHKHILAKLLDSVGEIDFKLYLHLTDKDPKKSDCVFAVVKNVLEVAREKGWRLCRREDFAYLFNGAYWAYIEDGEVRYFLSESAKRMGMAEREACYFRTQDDFYKQFIASSFLPKASSTIPEGVTTVNLLNGTFEVSPQGKNLREPRAEDFITYQLQFDYDKDAECPEFMRYLNKVLPNKESQGALAEYMGYIFIPHHALKLEKVLILYGSGANGKSVFYEVMTALVGSENSSSYSLEDLTGNKSDSMYYRAAIANKLINYSSEISNKVGADKFKKLVSGEPMEARQPYGRPMIIENYAKLAFNCNELPVPPEQTKAFYRRFLIIPFTETIQPDEQDVELPKRIIKNELSGVFNWVFEGLERLLKNKRFTESEQMKEVLRKYEDESDSVKQFIDDFPLVKTYEDSHPVSRIFAAYNTYCTENGYKKVSIRKFRARLEKWGFKSEKKRNAQVIYCKIVHEPVNGE